MPVRGGIFQTAGAAGTPSGKGSGNFLTDLFSDQNVLNLLGGTGSNLSQGQPIGQALGGPTQQFIQSRAAQTALEGQEARRNEQIQMIIKALGGVTPQGQAGVTGVKRGKTGTLTLDMDLAPDVGEEGEPVAPSAQALQLPPPSGQEQPRSGAPTESTAPRQRQQLSNIVPF